MKFNPTTLINRNPNLNPMAIQYICDWVAKNPTKQIFNTIEEINIDISRFPKFIIDVILCLGWMNDIGLLRSKIGLKIEKGIYYHEYFQSLDDIPSSIIMNDKTISTEDIDVITVFEILK